ncbi:MAG: histidinol-phosphatase HisJ family protein [Anaerolineae bacterium]|nr:histidinol-phosphatase HisJ family protein [Anaerolineae bacterium]
MSTIAEHAQQAARLGLRAIGFCEHADFDPRDRSYRTLDPTRYDRELDAARLLATGVDFSQGVEITYQASREDEIHTWLGERTWDYVVVSVHLVDFADGWTMVSEARAVQDYYSTHTQQESYQPYFEELRRAARSGLGAVLGHFDLVKRYGAAHYGAFDPADLEQEIRTVLHVAATAGMAIEINTSGLRQAPREPYPGLQVLRWFRQEGGRLVTIGSDAHQASDLAAGTSHALELARAAGLTLVTSFHHGQVRGYLDPHDL